MWCVSICLQRTQVMLVCVSECTSVYECVQNVCRACAIGREGEGRRNGVLTCCSNLCLWSTGSVSSEKAFACSLPTCREGEGRERERMRGGNGGRGKIEIFGAGGEDVKIKIDQDPESRSKVPHHEHFESLHHALLASMGLREWGYLRGKERSKEKAKKEQEN
jgi:hypothetical protein